MNYIIQHGRIGGMLEQCFGFSLALPGQLIEDVQKTVVPTAVSWLRNQPTRFGVGRTPGRGNPSNKNSICCFINLRSVPFQYKPFKKLAYGIA